MIHLHAVLRRQKVIYKKFIDKDAICESKALTKEELGIQREHLVAGMIHRQIVAKTNEGKYYLDQERLNGFNKGKVKGLMLFLIIALFILAIDILSGIF